MRTRRRLGRGAQKWKDKPEEPMSAGNLNNVLRPSLRAALRRPDNGAAPPAGPLPRHGRRHYHNDEEQAQHDEDEEERKK